MKKLFTASLCLQLLLVPTAWSQDEDDFVKSTQNDILVVGAAGAAGAVLGLSTLSFVDKPSQHLGNIWTGAALGVILGVVWVAYNGAQKGQEDLESSVHFSSHERLAWHQTHADKLTVPEVQFGTSFWSQSF